MTTPVAFEVEGLAKRYQLGTVEQRRYKTMRDAFGQLWRNPIRRRVQNGPHIEHDSVWALRDVSFQLEEGQALGIIGRNGAGKSTLLKILSRITTPTAGVARVYGRVASLLEVGTGFHPELTGRENVFLNGAILGMTRAEIRRNFDDIVSFAEVEKFIDTPVKRYSSGMYVRLAFAVAAHLTPEILIVDEVLAVGDHEFQKRCLGRMQEVAHSGRSVLFVSHNMATIEELCEHSILLIRGQVECIGPTRDVVATYLRNSKGRTAWSFEDYEDREGTGNARITRLELLDVDLDTPLHSVQFRQSFRLRIHYRATRRLLEPRFGFALLSEIGERITLSQNSETGDPIASIAGEGYIDCLIKNPNLLPGTYCLEVWIVEVVNVHFADCLRMVAEFKIEAGNGGGTPLGNLVFPNRGRVLLDCCWTSFSGEAVINA